jgi:DNA-binding NarL/FixJ family response regulator
MVQRSIPRGNATILVHPCEIVRDGIGLLLEQSGYQVPLLAESCESFLEQFDDEKVDVVLIHYSQSKPKGVIKKVIDRTDASVALLASSDAYHQDTYSDMLGQIAEGVTGFLDMDEPRKKFLSELDDIIGGDVVVSRNFIKHLRQNGAAIEERLDKTLSKREREILDLVGKGNTNKEVGEELFISENTVKVHLKNILAKLNLKNRQQLIAYAVRKSLIRNEET